MTTVAILGAGLVGQRTASLLASLDDTNVVLAGLQRRPPPIDHANVGHRWSHIVNAEADIVVLATTSAKQPAYARRLVEAGTHVVTTADNPDDIEQLMKLNRAAADAGVVVVVGAAYSPGVSTLLASHLARQFDSVHTIRTAQFGTGGPACAREHHRAMSRAAQEVHGGAVRASRGGSGRELVWFPDPVGAADCYRAGLADPVLLHHMWPNVQRIESRQAATRRDRLTARLPMLRPPHAEGTVGAVWAEVRGRVDGRVEHRTMAATAPQATGAAAMAAACCTELAKASSSSPENLADLVGVAAAAAVGDTRELLLQVSNDVSLWSYDSSQIVVPKATEAPLQAARKWRGTNEKPGFGSRFPDRTVGDR